MRKKDIITKLFMFVILLCLYSSVTTRYTEAKTNDETRGHDLMEIGSCNISRTNFFAQSDLKDAATSKKTYYDQLKKQLMKRSTHFTINYKGNYRDVYEEPKAMLEKIRLLDDKSTSDDGDFLFGSITYISYYIEYSSTNAKFDFTVTYTENQQQVKKLNKEIKKILKSLNVTKLSEIGKVKAIHDYVVNHVDYDMTMVDHSAYGAVIGNKRTVCQGYSLLMYKMLTDAGVPAHYVTGYAGEPHAWNIVKLNGKWYHLDATWDDPISSTPVLSYEYFLIGSTKLRKDHQIDKIYTKLYSISKSDYDWKKALDNSKNKEDKKYVRDETKEERELEEETRKRRKFINEINRYLDEELDYANENDMMKSILDLYKKIFSYVIRELPDDKFELLYADDETYTTKFITVCGDCINNYLIKPITIYIESDQCYNDVLERIQKEYSDYEILAMSDDELYSLVISYQITEVKEKVQMMSTNYFDTIVYECLQELK